MTELERIRELGRLEGERLREVRPITESEQQQLRTLIGNPRRRAS